jgi:mannose-6-phosphate isomerase-like protein (cupin superfamily)
MDARFNEIFTSPENSVFRVVFYPDRIYHAAYLNATRSERYRYNVTEVRNTLDITVLKGQVYLDGDFLCNFLRVEYRASRLLEQAREKTRFMRGEILGWVRVMPQGAPVAEATLKLRYCPWVDAYQVEVWETLEPPPGKTHDFSVLDLMGNNNSITRVKSFGPALKDIKALRQLSLAFRENDRDLPFGWQIANPEWDNNYLRSHQEPRTQEPSSQLNTVSDMNYFVDFQRGWFLQTKNIAPVRYRNAMMGEDNPDRRDDNVLEMRWIVQRELGGSLVFFHEVTIPPGMVEGTHRHIGTEELYYVVEGQGIAYLGENDDPSLGHLPTVQRAIFGLEPRPCKEIPVGPGDVIFLKSGGIHGIRNPGTVPLKFAAFLYHTT